MKLGEWKISIDDGFCEYEFVMELGPMYSIDDIHNKICEKFNTIPGKGNLRISYDSKNTRQNDKQ